MSLRRNYKFRARFVSCKDAFEQPRHPGRTPINLNGRNYYYTQVFRDPRLFERSNVFDVFSSRIRAISDIVRDDKIIELRIYDTEGKDYAIEIKTLKPKKH